MILLLFLLLVHYVNVSWFTKKSQYDNYSPTPAPKNRMHEAKT